MIRSNRKSYIDIHVDMYRVWHAIAKDALRTWCESIFPLYVLTQGKSSAEFSRLVSQPSDDKQIPRKSHTFRFVSTAPIWMNDFILIGNNSLYCDTVTQTTLLKLKVVLSIFGLSTEQRPDEIVEKTNFIKKKNNTVR